MWLINTSTFQLHEFTGSTPPYATFSYHMEESKATFEDLLQIPRYLCRDGIKILEKACSLVRATGSAWLWNQDACVEKRSCAAQTEAMNALAQIYRGCEQSIIYLHDLDRKVSAERTIREKLAGCRWINNIWAIPQIIFPRETCFYSSDWSAIGTKTSWLADLSLTMGVDQPVLENSDCLEDYSIARRMSWASRMTALRIEDYAYALIGLFDVSMSIIYGEGFKAFRRLQEQIMRDTDDFSLLAWDVSGAQEFRGVFAPSPSCFERFRTGATSPLRLKGEAQMHCSGITIQTFFWKTETGLLLPLESQDGAMCFIPLVHWDDYFVRRTTPVKWELPGTKRGEFMRIRVKRDVSTHVSSKISSLDENVRENSFEYLESLGHDSTARISDYFVMGYGSNYGTGSMASSEDGYGIESQKAPAMISSEATSQEGFLAQSTYNKRTMEGALSALGIDMGTSWAHETISKIYHTPRGRPVDDTEEATCRSSHGEFPSFEVSYRSEARVPKNGSPAVEAQHLDVTLITEELARVALGQFLSGRQGQSKRKSFIQAQRESRKRPKLTQSVDQLEPDDISGIDIVEAVPVTKQKFFACPFHIWNNKYTKCVTRHQLRSIEDVKEHVTSEHRRRMFCPVCKGEFPTGRDRDSHIRLRNCQRNDSAIPEGITDSQEEQLDREDGSTLAEDLRWFHIWNIIFPHIERPSSAFYTGEREVNVCAFREFWVQNGEQTVAAFLEKKQCRSYSIRNEERTLRAIYDLVEESVVDRLFGDFGDLKLKH